MSENEELLGGFKKDRKSRDTILFASFISALLATRPSARRALAGHITYGNILYDIKAIRLAMIVAINIENAQ